MAITTPVRSLFDLRPWLAAGLIAGLAVLALARPSAGDLPSDRARTRTEFLHQDIQADAIVQSLNDLDGQGWEIFQILPTWQIKNDNGEAALSPKSYQVFGRRPLRDAR